VKERKSAQERVIHVKCLYVGVLFVHNELCSLFCNNNYKASNNLCSLEF
jgi:hypothetical protein